MLQQPVSLGVACEPEDELGSTLLPHHTHGGSHTREKTETLLFLSSFVSSARAVPWLHMSEPPSPKDLPPWQTLPSLMEDRSAPLGGRISHLASVWDELVGSGKSQHQDQVSDFSHWTFGPRYPLPKQTTKEAGREILVQV